MPDLYLNKNLSQNSDEHTIAETSNEAASCKLYASVSGYFIDPFLPLMLRVDCFSRLPEINRGYALRVLYIRHLVDHFLAIYPDCQIVNIGGGLDTLFWNLHENGRLPEGGVFEIDFDTVTKAKIRRIKSEKKLYEPLENFKETNNGTHLISPNYNLIACDIRQEETLKKSLLSANFSTSRPTLFIAECVLVYISDDEIHKLLHTLSQISPCSAFINYDPMGFEDKFGTIMDHNFHKKKYQLLGKKSCSNIEAHEAKFLNSGWDNAKAISMRELYTDLMPRAVRIKIDSIEFLDEIELLIEILSHYCISIGFKNIPETNITQIISFFGNLKFPEHQKPSNH